MRGSELVGIEVGEDLLGGRGDGLRQSSVELMTFLRQLGWATPVERGSADQRPCFQGGQQVFDSWRVEPELPRLSEEFVKVGGGREGAAHSEDTQGDVFVARRSYYQRP